MAKAQVTLKLGVQELQVVNEALRMFAHAWRPFVHTPLPSLDGYHHDLSMVDDNPSQAQAVAKKVINDIGLKGG